MSYLNDLRDEIYQGAADKGFHNKEEVNLPTALMLVVSELSEALEALRGGKHPLFEPEMSADKELQHSLPNALTFSEEYRGTFEEEIADAIIRLLDIAGMVDMDVDWWVKAKMIYNKERPYKHGKGF
jgi:NTP pyrophosphatase (non-canonical NTP hydrolase)